MSGHSGRSLLATVLIVVGAVMAVLGAIAGHANRELLDGPAFASNVNEIRKDDDVARLVGEEISRQITAANPDLAALRPLIDDVSIRVAGGDLLSGPVRTAADAAYEALAAGDGDAIVLRISDAGAVVTSVLAAVAPDQAPVSTDVSVTLAEIGGQEFAHGVVDVARTVDLLAWLLPLVALLCFALAVAVSPGRWRTAGATGRALLWAAVALGLLLVIGGFVMRRLDHDSLTGAVAGAAWSVVIRPMWWSVVALAVIGALIVFACDSAAPGAFVARAGRVRRAIVSPASTLGRVARAVAAAVIGVAAVLDPLGLIEPLIAFAGAGLVLFALAELSLLAGADRQVDASSAERPAPGGGRRIPVTGYVAIGLAVVVAAVAVVVQARPSGDVDTAVAAVATEGCNGHVELCDRRFDEVAYAASHNSMSVLDEPGWFLAEQTDPIPAQLDAGVRALLVDVWSGRAASSSVVRTAASSYEAALEVANEELGPEVVDAALRIAESIAGPARGPERRYMCHGLCETGATDFVGTLEAIRGWLVTHPTDVVTLFIEDHVDADLIAEDIEAAGLLPFVATPPNVGDPWPTLGEMIDGGGRLVVMLEHGDGGSDAPWLVNGFDHTQDTPYTFPTVDDFSCAPNRGPDDAPLFLVNHWLANFDTLVSDAELVNAHDVLLGRMEQCRAERGQIPNFVAVNYVDRGDLYGVVDELNGVAEQPAAP